MTGYKLTMIVSFKFMPGKPKSSDGSTKQGGNKITILFVERVLSQVKFTVKTCGENAL